MGPAAILAGITATQATVITVAIAIAATSPTSREAMMGTIRAATAQATRVDITRTTIQTIITVTARAARHAKRGRTKDIVGTPFTVPISSANRSIREKDTMVDLDQWDSQEETSRNEIAYPQAS